MSYLRIFLSQQPLLRTLLVLLQLQVFVHCYASNLGIPEVKNFAVEDYNGAPQNWDIAQGEDWRLYFANNKGLIVHDGISWTTYPLPQKTILRSIEVWDDGKILAGGQSELGYFEQGPDGKFVYRSLLELIPEKDRLFADVWNLTLLESGFAFKSNGKVYCYQDSSIYVEDLGEPILQLAAVGDELFAQRTATGQMLRFSPGEQPRPFAGDFSFQSDVVNVLPDGGDGFLVFTIRNGIYQVRGDEVKPWQERYQSFFKDIRISDAILMSDGSFAIGTSLGGGLIIMDQEGRAKYRIDRKSGLQSNSVYRVFEDVMGDIWLGLDNGIDLVAMSSPVKRFFPDGDATGAGYAARIYQDHIYFGSNYGLYRIPWKSYYDPISGSDRFEKVAGSEGQVWGLNEQGGKLLMGHHEGAFLIEGASARKMVAGGTWDFVPIPKEGEVDRMAVGTYTGMSLFGRESGEDWQYLRQLDAPEESSRIIISDERGWIWVTHPYRGVWRCSFEGDQISEIKFYGEEEGFPSNRGIYAFDLGTEIVFCAETGIYRYIKATDRFELHEEFTLQFGSESWIQKLVTDPDGDLWFVENDRVGLLRVDESSLSKKVEKMDFEVLNGQLVGGHELIYPTGDGDVFFATSKGFLQYREEWLDKQSNPFEVMLLEATARDKRDSLVATYVSLQQMEADVVYPAGTSTFRFSFSDNQYSGLVPSMYQFYLEGLDVNWGEWTERTEKEYTNLRPGSYKFHLRSRDDFLKESEPVVFEFRIQAPWYESSVAYVLYGLILIAALASLVVIPRKRYEKDKKKLQVQQQRTLHEQQLRHQKEEEARERQIVELKNEKLKAELDHQNQELASATMHLVQKNSLISKVKDDLTKITKLEDPSEMSKITRQLLGILNRDAMLDDEWEQFSMQFDKVHHDFLARLKEKFPKLSPKDLKLCAFLKMNLTTKEIAPLLNISVRGVEISRYRLRKKLQLSSEVNLVEYMMEV